MQELGFIPASIVGGESIWISAENTARAAEDIILDDYTPADGYTLAYQFAASTPITVNAVANDADTGWTLEVTGAQTLTFPPGRVAFTGIITHTSSTRTFAVDYGGVYTYPSPGRVSQWVAVLAAVDAAMLTVASSPGGSISIDGMSITYKGTSDLTRIRSYAQNQLNRDSGTRSPRRILSRFT